MRTLLSITFVALLAIAASAQDAKIIPAPADLTAPPNDAVKTSTGLISKMMKPGTSDEKPIATDVVTVNYTGWRSDGMMFDSSVARGQASTFPLDKVMAGWRECVTQMTIGERWTTVWNRGVRYRAGRDPVQPADCATRRQRPACGRQANGQRSRLQGVTSRQRHAQPKPILTGERALHGMDDRWPHVRQLDSERHAEVDAARRGDQGLERGCPVDDRR
jgi:hypothetical protein